MNSFLNFIKEDIEAKKTLINTLPVRTKRDKTKYSEKINVILEKYDEYRKTIKKYIDVKSKSFEIPLIENNKQKLIDQIDKLEKLKSILNPANSYIEKIGFDSLLCEMNNYYDFKFKSVNRILNDMLDKFELVGIRLNKNDFDYNCYVHQYMIEFLNVRNIKSEDYSKVGEIFESIYWYNPELIHHIELNFRKLIRNNDRKFTDYVNKRKKEITLENKINTYDECNEKLKELYLELREEETEDICMIIEAVKEGTLDMNRYFEDSKVRMNNFSSLMIDFIDYKDDKLMQKFYSNVKKLKYNLEEYANYMKFLPIIEYFKKTYEKDIGSLDNKKLKTIETKIIEVEKKLSALNKKIGFDSKTKNDIKQEKLKVDSVKFAKDLQDLYKQYDDEYFKSKTLSILNKTMTVGELLELYNSFEYFKNMTIKNVYDIHVYEDIINKSKEFNRFAMNPLNVIMNGTFVFENNKISQAIMNKYRLDNINLTVENLQEEELENLIDKINFVLRIDEIAKSSLSVDKIWFIGQVAKINNALTSESRS